MALRSGRKLGGRLSHRDRFNRPIHRRQPQQASLWPSFIPSTPSLGWTGRLQGEPFVTGEPSGDAFRFESQRCLRGQSLHPRHLILPHDGLHLFDIPFRRDAEHAGILTAEL
jgi:hypothetical protein